jgi:hypothetical protein
LNFNRQHSILIEFETDKKQKIMTKLKMWSAHSSWDEAEQVWDQQAKNAALQHPIKKLKQLPEMVGITEDTAKQLKWKSLKWMILKDAGRKVFKECLKHPLRYGWNLMRSALKKKSYVRDEDFFLYGIKTVEKFAQLLEEQNTLLVIGFSYCHKPFECPSGRFSAECIHDIQNPVCQQCFIGKCVHALPEANAIPLFIPTIHYIGKKILEIVHANPRKKVLFLITACELTLEMFGDWGNMVSLQGIGVRLDGRICNTMKAFELSEQGIKPGLTVVLDQTQRRILDLIQRRRTFTHL